MLGVAYLIDFLKSLSLSFLLVISFSSLLDKGNYEYQVFILRFTPQIFVGGAP